MTAQIIAFPSHRARRHLHIARSVLIFWASVRLVLGAIAGLFWWLWRRLEGV